MASYARKHSLMETARKYSITDPHGHISSGLTYQIIHGYEPRRPETRKRLGLPEKISIPRPRRSINDHLVNDHLLDMPDPLLAWAITNREEMQ